MNYFKKLINTGQADSNGEYYLKMKLVGRDSNGKEFENQSNGSRTITVAVDKKLQL